jgi:hypothetical protein
LTAREGFVQAPPARALAEDAEAEPRNHPHFDSPLPLAADRVLEELEQRDISPSRREPRFDKPTAGPLAERQPRPAKQPPAPEPRPAEPIPDDEVAAAAMANVAGPATAPPAETWPIVVKLLHKQTRNNKNEPISELRFREPTGGDINRYGNPVRIDQDGEIIIDERKMTAIISILSGVLLPFIEALDPRDWNSCAYRLRSFFIPNPSAW